MFQEFNVCLARILERVKRTRRRLPKDKGHLRFRKLHRKMH